MSCSKRPFEQDPEYDEIPSEVQEKRIKVIETDMRKRTEKKISSIVESQFGEELANKDSEMDKIDDALQESRTILDRLRACIVTKFYTQEEIRGNDDSTPGIHPAVKPFLGKAPKYYFGCSGLDASSETNIQSEKEEESRNNIDTVFNAVKNKNDECLSLAVESLPFMPQVPRIRMKYEIVIGNVSKFIPACHRVGNEDMTHLWKVYVRENKDFPKLDTIVKKVCFLLHPSFRPNDIVEVSVPPFEISRRGWGDFPLRVQLHFKDACNKPVDIIHHLKLDKTYTGLTTLGPETHVEMQLLRNKVLLDYVHPVPISNESLPSATTVPVSSENAECIKSPIKTAEPILHSPKVPVKNQCNGLQTSPVIDQTKTCPVENQEILSPNKVLPNSISITNNTKKNLGSVLLNGATPFLKCTDSQGRTLLVPQSSLLKLKTSSMSQSSERSADNKLKGIPANRVPLYVLKLASSQTNKANQKVLLVSKPNDMKVKLGKLSPQMVKSNESVVNGKDNEKELVKVNATGNDAVVKPAHLNWHQVLQNTNVSTCKTFEMALKQVIHLFPVIHKNATDRSTFPFSSPSWDDYVSWNVGKRKASEWQRAGMIRTAVLSLMTKRTEKGLPSFDVWSRKKIVLFCQRYGYTPRVEEYKNVQPNTDASEICSLSDAKNLMQDLKSQAMPTSKDEEVNVETPDVPAVSNITQNNHSSSVHNYHDYTLSSQTVYEPHSSPAALFVKESASQICISLKPIEFEPGIAVPAVEEMILSVCKLLTEDILRSAANQNYSRTNGRGNAEVSLPDVYLAIKETPSFSFLTNSHLGVMREHQNAENS